MIRVTGDTHGEFSRLGNKRMLDHNKHCAADYVIVAGDAGLIWNFEYIRAEYYWLKFLNEKPFDTIFVLGNHENYERIYDLPLVEKYGGLVYKISEKVCALQHGRRYIIDNKKIFVFGGATSTDKAHRKDRITWWEEEVPSATMMRNAYKVLEENDWDFDYVITHTAPNSVVEQLLERLPKYEKTTRRIKCAVSGFLESIAHTIKCKAWLFGHFHVDENIKSDGVDYHCLRDKFFDIV